VTQLAWREVERQDRLLLQGFTCTVAAAYDPSRGQKVHPRPWELEVQSYIRNYRPPAGPGETFLLGLDNEGIGAVSCAAIFDKQPEVIKLLAVAVSTRYRGQGGAVADEALLEGLNAAADLGVASGLSVVSVFGLIHSRNLASQGMCQRHGFTYEGDDPDEPDYQVWSVAVSRES
jgi:hypothetical protein